MALNEIFYNSRALTDIKLAIAKAESKYETLSDLWDSKSKAKIHTDISKKMDDVLTRLDNLKRTEREITAQMEKALVHE